MANQVPIWMLEIRYWPPLNVSSGLHWIPVPHASKHRDDRMATLLFHREARWDSTWSDIVLGMIMMEISFVGRLWYLGRLMEVGCILCRQPWWLQSRTSCSLNMGIGWFLCMGKGAPLDPSSPANRWQSHWEESTCHSKNTFPGQSITPHNPNRPMYMLCIACIGGASWSNRITDFVIIDAGWQVISVGGCRSIWYYPLSFHINITGMYISFSFYLYF